MDTLKNQVRIKPIRIGGSNLKKTTVAADQLLAPTVGNSFNEETSSAQASAATRPMSSSLQEMKKPVDTDTFYNNMLTILSPQRLITRKKLKSDIR